MQGQKMLFWKKERWSWRKHLYLSLSYNTPIYVEGLLGSYQKKSFVTAETLKLVSGCILFNKYIVYDEKDQRSL